MLFELAVILKSFIHTHTHSHTLNISKIGLLNLECAITQGLRLITGSDPEGLRCVGSCSCLSTRLQKMPMLLIREPDFK